MSKWVKSVFISLKISTLKLLMKIDKVTLCIHNLAFIFYHHVDLMFVV